MGCTSSSEDRRVSVVLQTPKSPPSPPRLLSVPPPPPLSPDSPTSPVPFPTCPNQTVTKHHDTVPSYDTPQVSPLRVRRPPEISVGSDSPVPLCSPWNDDENKGLSAKPAGREMVAVEVQEEWDTEGEMQRVG
eukprot:Hpha_TRINITY_DN1950_c0_g2::TRINITY_DN1950_c0_g2_i1::g.31002::m.31002